MNGCHFKLSNILIVLTKWHWVELTHLKFQSIMVSKGVDVLV